MSRYTRTANDTIPTRIYSSGVFIAYAPFLQALAAFGEADERQKRDNGHHDNNQIKHVVPPHLAVGTRAPQLFHCHFEREHSCVVPPPQPVAAVPRSEMAWAGTPAGETPPAGVDSPARRKVPPRGASGRPHRSPAGAATLRAARRAAPPTPSGRAGRCQG